MSDVTMTREQKLVIFILFFTTFGLNDDTEPQ